MRKVVAIIQARTGSTRLPGKVLKKIKGKSVLEHVIERVKQSKFINQIVIATTDLEQDDILVAEIKRIGVNYFRGSEEDVLSRYYLAAKENDADVVVRITSDCPLIDPKITDDIIEFYLNNNYTMVTNGGPDLTKRTYPRGLDTEVFSFKALESAFINAKENYHREHVTPYIYEKYTDIYYYMNKEDYSQHRWTLDTVEDLELIKRIYNELYKGKHDFYLQDILKFIKNNPELSKINEHVKQKNY